MPKTSDISVLVVDDQQGMRGLMRYALHNMGLRQISEARSGLEALRVLETTPVTLILADWLMDKGDGLSLLKTVRRDPRLRKLPFIMVTGLSDKAQVQAAIAAGVSNYVVKPFDAATLRKKIEAVVGAIEA